MSEEIRVLSFFSGAGGLDLGFHQAGFNIVFASDLIPLFCESMKANKGVYVSSDAIIAAHDIRDIDSSSLPNNIDFIIGGPPCQTFSASGRRAGGAAGQLDGRGTLFQAYGKIIQEKQPKGFLFENVRGILGSNKGKDWEDIKQYFTDLGYTLDYRLLDACDYGAPQHRERLILVGHKMNSEFCFPRPLYGPDSLSGHEHISVGEAFDVIENDSEAKELEFTGGKYSHLLKEVPEGENYLYFTEKRGYPNPIFAYRSRFSDFLYKADPQKPTKTIIASPGKYTGPLHWDNRYFTINEYKVIQGFPIDYKILGNRNEIIKQIGNSVSPKIAHILAQAVKKQIFNHPEIDIDLIEKKVPLSFDKRKGAKAKRTKQEHDSILKSRIGKNNKKYSCSSYKTSILPYSGLNEENNVICTLKNGKSIDLSIHGDDSKLLLIEAKLGFGLKKSIEKEEGYEKILNVQLFGEGDHCIQTMWNAIDDWVIRSSSFHSLFEVYGHFTEPHPDFHILNFNIASDKPICIFAKYISDFNVCSKFLYKKDLLELFSGLFKKTKWIDLLMYLREFRFDVRSSDINIAIDPDKYMIAYPFALPLRKQMNFKPKFFKEEEIPYGSINL